MAGELARVVAERKAALKALYSTLKDVDTRLEYQQRELKRLISRKRAMPEAPDLTRIIESMHGMDTVFSKYVDQMTNTVSLFNAY
jgi:hypothetical protein